MCWPNTAVFIWIFEIRVTWTPNITIEAWYDEDMVTDSSVTQMRTDAAVEIWEKRITGGKLNTMAVFSYKYISTGVANGMQRSSTTNK